MGGISRTCKDDAAICLSLEGLRARPKFPSGMGRTYPGRFLHRLAPARWQWPGLGWRACPGAEERTFSLQLLSANGCIASGVGMQNSLWSEALADCISP